MTHTPIAAAVSSPLHKERLAEFDYLRALAIALIVLGHSVFLSEKGFPLLLENILRGGTGVFVFISGFFFHRVFFTRFNYRDFMGKKLKQIFVPFIAMSVLGLVFRSIGWAVDGHSLSTIALNCWYTARNGYVLFPHWYIPFILLTFACSPLHMAYIRLGWQAQLGLLISFTLIALLMHRPDSNINQFQSLVYFAPFYLLGILFSRYNTELRRHQTLICWSAAVLASASLLFQTYVFPHVGNYHKFPFVWHGIDWQLLQKVGLCLLLLALCRQVQSERLARHLRLLAELSFPIFFVHPLLAMVVENVIHLGESLGVHAHHDAFSALWISSLIFVFQFYGSVLLILAIRRRFGAASRWVIG